MLIGHQEDPGNKRPGFDFLTILVRFSIRSWGPDVGSGLSNVNKVPLQLGRIPRTGRRPSPAVKGWRLITTSLLR
jgi:hypothetical protein